MAKLSHTLLDPITVRYQPAGGGPVREETITVIDLDLPDDGKLRVSHLKQLDGHEGPAAEVAARISLFSGHPIKVVEEMTERDFVRVAMMIEGFLKPGRATGETA
jgi:hypothetical protein